MTATERLPWHASLWDGLEQAAQQNRIAHAYLLAGPAGLGKRLFAAQFAQALLCSSSVGRLQPCGQCRACRDVAAGTHPDYIRQGLSEDSKVIKVEDIRDFTGRLYLTNERAQGKVSLIDPADALNGNSANALLKTLEEPPADSHILLVANRPMRLPATIRSRCQLLRFSRPGDSIALDWMKLHATSAAQTELSHARGAPLLAVVMAENGMADRRQQWQADLSAVCSGKISPLEVANRWQKDDLPVLMAWMHNWLVDTAKLRLGMPAEELVNTSSGKPLQAYAQSISPAGLSLLAITLTEARRLLDRQVSLQLVLENLLASWYQECRFNRRSA